MRKLAKIAWLTCMMLVLASVNASAKGVKEESSEFDWSPVIDAIIDVESEGNAKAVDRSGKSCGILQITPVMVKECNRIQAKRKSKKRYSLEDRFSVKKSKEMFVLFQSFYNPQNSIERAIRLWNGGIGFSKRATQKYFEKVMSKMK